MIVLKDFSYLLIEYIILFFLGYIELFFNFYWLASARKSLKTKSFRALYACIKLNGLEAVAFKPLFFYVDYLITDLIPIPF